MPSHTPTVLMQVRWSVTAVSNFSTRDPPPYRIAEDRQSLRPSFVVGHDLMLKGNTTLTIHTGYGVRHQHLIREVAHMEQRAVVQEHLAR